MGYIKKICALSLVGSLAMASGSVEASNNIEDTSQASSTVIDPYSEIPLIDGETSVGLQVIDPLANLSFEVPLYVTMAVTDGETEVLTPDNYGITNLSKGNDDSDLSVAVIWVEVTPRATNTYWDFIVGEPSADNEMELTVGGMPLVLDTDGPFYMDLTESVFYDNGKYVPIGYGESEKRIVPIIGRVKAAARSNKQAVAQFSISYTISQLDNNGNPVATFYEGAYPEGYLE